MSCLALWARPFTAPKRQRRRRIPVVCLMVRSKTLTERCCSTLPKLRSAETIGLFVFPDGVSLSLEHFFAGLEGTLSSERFLPMWGGGAGNNYIFGEPTYQYCDDEVVSDGVSYALLSGRARASWALSHSLIPIGGERKVTRSQGNIIYEIDGKPATEVLNEYLPEGALADERDWSRYAYS